MIPTNIKKWQYYFVIGREGTWIMLSHIIWFDFGNNVQHVQVCNTQNRSDCGTMVPMKIGLHPGSWRTYFCGKWQGYIIMVVYRMQLLYIALVQDCSNPIADTMWLLHWAIDVICIMLSPKNKKSARQVICLHHSSRFMHDWLTNEYIETGTR